MATRSAANRGTWSGIQLSSLTSGSRYGDAQVSPNGQFLSYSSRGLIFVAKIEHHNDNVFLETGTIQQVTTEDVPLGTGTEYGGATYCWGEDSSHIFFSSGGHLYQVDLHGKPPRKLKGIEGSLMYCPHQVGGNLYAVIEDNYKIQLGVLSLSQSDLQNAWFERVPIGEDITFVYDPDVNRSTGKIAIHTWSNPYMLWDQSSVLLLDSGKGGVKTVYSRQRTQACSPKFSPDGKHLAFLCDESGFLNLWIADADGNNARQLLKEDSEVGYSSLWVTGSSPFIWLSSDRISYVANIDGDIKLRLLVIGNDHKVETKDLPVQSGYYYNLRSLGNGRHFTVEFTNYMTPNTILVVDAVTGTSKAILSSGVKVLENLFVAPQVIHYPITTGSGGITQSHGLLYIQKDDDHNTVGAPLIVFVHGGPTGMSANRWNPFVEYFASLGWAVFCPNHRGSVGYGRAYRESLNGNWGLHDMNDTVDSLEYLKQNFMVDTKRSVIMGGSAGGFTTLNIIANKPGKFSVAVDICGVGDLLDMDENTHMLERYYNKQLIGKFPEESSKYIDRSPVTRAQNIVDPLLILHGDSDRAVPKPQSDAIKAKAKGPVEYHVLPGEGHMFFMKPAMIKKLYPIIQQFFLKYVLLKR